MPILCSVTEAKPQQFLDAWNSFWMENPTEKIHVSLFYDDIS